MRAPACPNRRGAFRCDPDSCGDEVELHVRPKIGFYNCDSGVADDDEVDLMSQRFVPLATGGGPDRRYVRAVAGVSSGYVGWLGACRRRLRAVAALRSSGRRRARERIRRRRSARGAGVSRLGRHGPMVDGSFERRISGASFRSLSPASGEREERASVIVFCVHN
jgi:hypothetical protein